jgi:hypothetical protein
MMGSRGSFVSSGSESFYCPVPSIKRPKDATGAGDLYASGFLFGWLSGYSIEQCARLGTLAGAEIVCVDGAELSKQKFDDIRREVNSQTQQHSSSRRIIQVANCSTEQSHKIYQQHRRRQRSKSQRIVSRSSTVNPNACNSSSPITSIYPNPYHHHKRRSRRAASLNRKREAGPEIF